MDRVVDRRLRSHRTCPHSHCTHSMRRVPRMGNQEVHWVSGKTAVCRRCSIHLRAGVGAGPPRRLCNVSWAARVSSSPSHRCRLALNLASRCWFAKHLASGSSLYRPGIWEFTLHSISHKTKAKALWLAGRVICFLCVAIPSPLLRLGKVRCEVWQHTSSSAEPPLCLAISSCIPQQNNNLNPVSLPSRQPTHHLMSTKTRGFRGVRCFPHPPRDPNHRHHSVED